MYKALARGRKIWQVNNNPPENLRWILIKIRGPTPCLDYITNIKLPFFLVWRLIVERKLSLINIKLLCICVVLWSSFAYIWKGFWILRWIFPMLCTAELMHKSWKNGLGLKLLVHWLNLNPGKEMLRECYRTLQKELGGRGVSATAVSLLLGSFVFLSWQMQLNPLF